MLSGMLAFPESIIIAYIGLWLSRKYVTGDSDL